LMTPLGTAPQGMRKRRSSHERDLLSGQMTTIGNH
jgi:hypothetical protein